jgi:hypothetical protein
MSWKDSVDFINDQTFDPDNGFGDQFVYYPNHGAGAPVTITAIRVRRSPDESNQSGAFEGIEVRESDFSDPPAGFWPSPGPWPLPVAGDVVTVDGVDYVITALRNPDPAGGTVVLLLNRRQRGPSA